MQNNRIKRLLSYVHKGGLLLIILCCINVSYAAPGKITGRVTDEKGLPMSGVTVQEKGIENGTTTNAEGIYTISLKGGTPVLVFSFVGYATQEIDVASRKGNVINVELASTSNKLSEVVVTGFGARQKKVSVVGAVTTISPRELSQPSSSLSAGFGGKLAGVITQQKSGEPGTNSQFWIRGIATMSGSTTPLIFLNDIEISSNDMNSIDPSNIESFSILKDASATALYGARGANGVILVRTKRGAEMAAPKITALVENSFATPTKIVELAKGVDYMNYYNEAMMNDNPFQALRYGADKIAGTAKGLDPYAYPDVDWYNMLFKKVATSQHANLNVQGGNKIVKYYAGIAYYKDQGLLRSGLGNDFKNNIDMNRINFVNNNNVAITKTTELELNINADYYFNSGPATAAQQLFSDVMGANPVDFPAYFPAISDGSTSHIYFGNATDGYNLGKTRTNPYAEMVKGYTQNFSSTVLTTLRVGQNLEAITKGLKLTGLISFKNFASSSVSRTYTPYLYVLNGYDLSDSKKPLYNISWIEAAGGSTALAQSPGSGGDRSLYMQANLNYNRTFNGKHDVSGMLVYLQSEYNTNTPGDIISSLPTRKQGLAARAAYGYDNKYFAEVNLGYTGSENFAEGHRFGLFPAVGASYVISNESFFKNSPIADYLTLLKLRASYGLTGNDNIGAESRFPYRSNVVFGGGYTTGSDFTNSRTGYKVKQYPNPDITWEKSVKFNAGIDLGLFNDFTLNVDFFREIRSSIFQQIKTIPSTAGVGSSLPYLNIGKVQNEGIDATMQYNKAINKDLNISARGTFSYAHNKALFYEEPDYASVGMEYLASTGRSLNRNTGLVAQRLFIDDKEASNTSGYSGGLHAGDIMYKDINGDGKIDDNDMITMGYPNTPEITYGFGLNIVYKKWDCGLFFQGTSHISQFISASTISPFGSYQKNLLSAIANDHWSVDNQNLYAFFPRLTAVDGQKNDIVNSTWWLRDLSFLRLKNAEIGFTPKKFVRIYARGVNLLTFSKFKLWDPEQGGGNGLGYPPQKVLNVGAQFTL